MDPKVVKLIELARKAVNTLLTTDRQQDQLRECMEMAITDLVMTDEAKENAMDTKVRNLIEVAKEAVDEITTDREDLLHERLKVAIALVTGAAPQCGGLEAGERAYKAYKAECTRRVEEIALQERIEKLEMQAIGHESRHACISTCLTNNDQELIAIRKMFRELGRNLLEEVIK